MDPDYDTKYAIHIAAREGRISQVESLLNANPKLVRLRDPDDRLPIHWAAAHNHLDIAQLLMARPDFDPDVSDASGWTPLLIASSLPDSAGVPLATLLLSKAASPSPSTTIASARTAGRQTALHLAGSKSSTATVRLLLAHGCPARARDSRGQLPLHRAAAVGAIPVLRLLIEEGRSPVDTADADGDTPLHLAVAEGHAEAALVLVRAGADVVKRDAEGRTAVQVAPDARVRDYVVRGIERERGEVESG